MNYLQTYAIIFFSLFLTFKQNTAALKTPDAVMHADSQKVWARRSVLDKIPRMLSIRLGQDNFAAYNTESGTLYKFWKGRINYDGSVYNGVHGFQPTSQGFTYLQETDTDLWQIKSKGKTFKPAVAYKGHRLLMGKITLIYELEFESNKIRIEETPSCVPSGEGKLFTNFLRTFEMSGAGSDVAVLLKTNSVAEKKQSDFKTNGIQIPSDQKTGDRNVVIALKNNATTTCFWTFETPGNHSEKSAEQNENVTTLIEKSDCYSCHNKEIKTVGPSFSEISARYKGVEEEFANRLALKVINGGAGNWGSILMPPHPDLSFAKATTLVNYILSVPPKKKTPISKSAQTVILKDTIPGDGFPLKSVHPGLTLTQARPAWFKPRIGGMDFLPDGRLAICTWDSLGAVYLLEGVQGNDPEKIKVKQIATGLAEPLGLKIVDGQIFIMQKQELTKLVDLDGDEIIDEYQTVCNSWKVSDNFHEFAFGLVYKSGYFYGTLATDINNGGTSTDPQIPDRGKVIKVSKIDGTMTFIATGLRTPNGIGEGPDGALFIADNQGDWLPSNKIIHLQNGAWYGSRAVDFDGTKNKKPVPPAVWLPQGDIANSPSQPILLNQGIYQNQLLFGDVSYGGLQRAFLEKINGQYQGAVFRFSQGLEAGINRVVWGPDSALYVGGVGLNWSWGQQGKLLYGLQRLTFNEKNAFEILAVRAKPGGIEIEMTEPLKADCGNKLEDYQIKQWWYLPTKDYGGPKMNEETLTVKNIVVSADRKKVYLKIPGIKAEHVIYVHLNKKTVLSKRGANLWTTEAWYTMNQIQGYEKNSAKSL